MTYTAMEWYRRANMAALGGGADIRTEDQKWLDWMESRHMSDWTAEEMQRYNELTEQEGPKARFERRLANDNNEPPKFDIKPEDFEEEDPYSDEPFEKENNV